MSKLEVQSVKEPREWSGQNGSTFYDYPIIGLLDGQLESVIITVKDQKNAPKEGDSLDGTVEEGKFGKKFKKANSFAGGFSGGSRSPEEQNMIMRQHAVSDAIALMAIAGTKTTTTKENALKLADYFLNYYKTGSYTTGSSETPSVEHPEQKQRGIKELVEDEQFGEITDDALAVFDTEEE